MNRRILLFLAIGVLAAGSVLAAGAKRVTGTISNGTGTITFDADDVGQADRVAGVMSGLITWDAATDNTTTVSFVSGSVTNDVDTLEGDDAFEQWSPSVYLYAFPGDAVRFDVFDTNLVGNVILFLD